MVTGGEDGNIVVRDLNQKLTIRFDKKHRRRATSVAISKDGRCAVSGGGNGEIIIWDIETNTAHQLEQKHHGSITQVCMDDDGRHAVSCCEYGKVVVWDLQQNSEIPIKREDTRESRSVSISGDGRYAVSGDRGDDNGGDEGGGKMFVWNIEIKQNVALKSNFDGWLTGWCGGHDGSVSCTSISHNGRYAVSGDITGQVVAWDIRGLSLIHI